MTKCGAGIEKIEVLGNEPLICNQRVRGSSPRAGSISKQLTGVLCERPHVDPLLENISNSHSAQQMRSTQPVLIGNGLFAQTRVRESLMGAYLRIQKSCEHVKRDPRGTCYHCGHRTK